MNHSAPVASPVEKPKKPEIVPLPMKEPVSESQEAPLLAKAKAHLYPNYAQPALVMDRGQGSQLWDTSGKRYIDFFAGIAVSTLGHCHPGLTAAIADQAQKLMHLSNYYFTAPNVELAGKLCDLTGMDRAFFCNSGTEAIEASLKLTRRHFFVSSQPEREVVLSFENSFHGRTMGSLAATGQLKYRDGFGHLGGVVHAPYGNLEAVSRLMSEKIAAIIVEPIQGEGGVVPAPEGFLAGLRKICDESGALLILDEVQTGVGRTGTFLNCEQVGVRPDVLALAKGLGGGFPIGAMLCTEALSGALPPGSHGTTYGGNPLGSRAALAVLEALEVEDLVRNVAARGAQLEARLDALVAKRAVLAGRRGRGFLQGLVLRDPSQGGEILAALREAGLLVTFAGGVALRLTPPLNISEAELSEGLAILDQVLGDFS